MSIGSDGTLAWSIDPMSGAYQLIEGDQLEQGMRQANLLTILLNIADRYNTFETVEQGMFDEEDTYKVRCSIEVAKVETEAEAEKEEEEEDEQFLYFTVDGNIFRAVETDNPQGLAILRFQDWEAFGDVKFFKKMLIEQGGMEMEMNFKEITINDTDAATFEPPDDVKKLAEEKDAAEPESQPDN